MVVSGKVICEKHKEEIQNRLKRIQGQVGGVLEMVKENRACLDVLSQITAARAALAKAAAIVIEHHMAMCLEASKHGEQVEESIEELKKLLNRFVE